MNILFMDVPKLLKALENEENEGLFNFTTEKLKEMNFNVLKELHLTKSVFLDYMQKLKTYKYIDEMNELKYGAFLRWIPITNPKDLPLKKGGVLCDIKVTDNGVMIICKGFMNNHFQFKMDECLIFQKLSDQELVLLSALDHLAK
jgi:hypothetical protein